MLQHLYLYLYLLLHHLILTTANPISSPTNTNNDKPSFSQPTHHPHPTQTQSRSSRFNALLPLTLPETILSLFSRIHDLGFTRGILICLLIFFSLCVITVLSLAGMAKYAVWRERRITAETNWQNQILKRMGTRRPNRSHPRRKRSNRGMFHLHEDLTESLRMTELDFHDQYQHPYQSGMMESHNQRNKLRLPQRLHNPINPPCSDILRPTSFTKSNTSHHQTIPSPVPSSRTKQFVLSWPLFNPESTPSTPSSTTSSPCLRKQYRNKSLLQNPVTPNKNVRWADLLRSTDDDNDDHKDNDDFAAEPGVFEVSDVDNEDDIGSRPIKGRFSRRLPRHFVERSNRT